MTICVADTTRQLGWQRFTATSSMQFIRQMASPESDMGYPMVELPSSLQTVGLGSGKADCR